MSKLIRKPIPSAWDNNWSGVGEEWALKMARLSTAKTFDRFHRHMVFIFGACSTECAAYLWNKIHPEKPRKYTESFFRFDPDKSIDGPGTSNNGDRARWAAFALIKFRSETGTEAEETSTVIQDLICDLGHFADGEQLDFAKLVSNGLATWQDER